MNTKRLCYHCLHYAVPLRQYSKNAGVWYLGCPKCASGVSYS